LPTSSDGKMRLSETLRSSTISLFPVPLNSSKMTSSILEPVSISAVAMIESDPPSPQGAYARSKVAGDAAVAAAAPRHFIVRVGCLYGHAGRNFPSTIVRRLRAGETVRADSERIGSPTWVKEVARASAALAVTDYYGVYHCTSQGETSWADFAREAARLLGLPDGQAQGVPSAALRLKAPRPRRAVLDNRALRARGLDTLSTWQGALAAFVAEETQLA